MIGFLVLILTGLTSGVVPCNGSSLGEAEQPLNSSSLSPPMQGSVPDDTVSILDRPTLTIGQVVGAGPAVFGEVSGVVRLDDGQIVVADSRSLELRFFSGDGRSTKVVGGDGEGPGEFRSLYRIAACYPDSVFAFDPLLSRVSVFSENGDFVRSMATGIAMNEGAPPRSFTCNKDGILGFLQRPSPAPPQQEGPYRPLLPVLLLLPNGTTVPLGEFPGSERYFIPPTDRPRPLGKITSVAIGADAVFVGTGDDLKILVVSFRGDRIGSLGEGTEPKRITRQDLAHFIQDQVLAQGARLGEQAVRDFFTRFEYPEFFPAHSSILTDPENRVWVQEFPDPAVETSFWRVFSPEGEKLARVEMPSRFELMEVGRDYALGVWKDENDVDFVKVFPVVRTRQ